MSCPICSAAGWWLARVSQIITQSRGWGLFRLSRSCSLNWSPAMTDRNSVVVKRWMTIRASSRVSVCFTAVPSSVWRPARRGSVVPVCAAERDGRFVVAASLIGALVCVGFLVLPGVTFAKMRGCPGGKPQRRVVGLPSVLLQCRCVALLLRCWCPCVSPENKKRPC